MIRYDKILVSAIISLLYSITVLAQNTDDWQIKGFVDTYHSVRSEKPFDFMSSRTRVRGEVGKGFDKSSLFVSFNATYNSLFKERTGFELREAYIDHREKHWGIRAGRQLVIWGTADGVRITDLVSPMDMSEFLAQDYDDIRMPVTALRLFFYNHIFKLDIVTVPVFQGYVLPVDKANPWSVLSSFSVPVVWNAGTGPEIKFKNIEYGGRLSFTFPGVDFSLSALYTWNKMPVLKYMPSGGVMNIMPEYHRMGFVGGDISKPLGQVVIRGEGAFNISKHFTYKPEAFMQPDKGYNTCNWLLGLDWYAPKEWMLSVQLSGEKIFGYEEYLSQEDNRLLATMNLSKKMFENSLTISDFIYFDIRNIGWFNRCSVDYSISDSLHFGIGYDWFGGDKGIFGIYRRNSEFWGKIKYCF